MAATTTGASTLANGNNRISGEASSSRYTADNSYTEPQSNAQKATTQHLEASNQMPSTQRQWWPAPGYGPSAYGPMGNPLARQQTNGTTDTEILQAFGGDFQPGLYKRPKSKVANPAPLGLAGFALTTFVLSCINLGTRGLSAPNIVVGPAFAYGGLCQLLAGMWELALGNTFGGWALPSYGGFWISLGIIFTPGGFDIAASYGGETASFYKAFGLYIFGWFIYTFLVWLMTLKSTVAFSSLFLFVWLTFLMLGCAYLDTTTTDDVTDPNGALVIAGGAFGIIAGFIAWWNMMAGLLDDSNSFFLIPVLHFPWSEKGRERRAAKIQAADAEKNA